MKISRIALATAAALAVGLTTAPAFAKSGKFDPYTDGAKMGQFDVFTDGAKIGQFNPYVDGAKIDQFNVYTDGAAR